MRHDDRLYQAFLAELRELEEFRRLHAAASPAAPLDREDPDLRRLVEAVAFFSARTHRAAVEGMAASRLRLLQQVLPYAVAPAPAMALVTARPGGRFVEALDLPRGTPLELKAGAGSPAIFRTVRDLRLLPLRVVRVALAAAGARLRLVVLLEAPTERRDEVGRLGFHVGGDGDLDLSLRLVGALRSSLRRAAVAWDEPSPEAAVGAPCEITFGAPGPAPGEGLHPLEQARRALHLPEAELFLEARVPPAPGPWRRLALLLDLDPAFPRELAPERADAFTPFATPVVNLEPAAARPFLFDGTVERVRLRHPDPAGGFALHSVRGVYRVEGGVRVPLRPALVADGPGSYEVERAEDGDEKGHWLHLHLPDAFERPCAIAVEAAWHQPAFSGGAGERLAASLRRQEVPGLQWEVSRAFAPAREGAAAAGEDALLHVLSLQKRARLDRDDLAALLDAAAGAWSGRYAPLRPLLAAVQVEERPLAHADRRGTTALVYRLGFRSLEAVRALATSFAGHVRAVLDAWVSDAVVSVEVEAAP